MSNTISPSQEGYIEEDLEEQVPFPQEWLDPWDPTNTTVGSLHYHVEAYLHNDTKNQLADAPYDLHNHWRLAKNNTVDKELLRILCTNDGSGLAISPTRVYLFIAWGYVTDAIELYEYISSLPATGAEAVTRYEEDWPHLTLCTRERKLSPALNWVISQDPSWRGDYTPELAGGSELAKNQLGFSTCLHGNYLWGMMSAKDPVHVWVEIWYISTRDHHS